MVNIKELIGKIHCADCLDVMRQLPDKCIDLVLTDPPYGINAARAKFKNGNNKHGGERFKDADWDSAVPTQEYFDEIQRISKNQIIFGWNYFSEKLPPCRCYIVWDKTIHGNSYADCEIAYTSFDKVARIHAFNTVNVDLDGRIHPTQKPQKLFEVLLRDYSEPGALVLDPFAGSGTTAVACHNQGRKFICIDKNEDYVTAANKRLAAAQKTQFLQL